MSAAPGEAEYVVVGSGAGGGTVAARLAEAGRTVVLLEAGGDAKDGTGGDRLPGDYDVPAFHGFASENDAMKWDFWVRHSADAAMQQRDNNYRPADAAHEAGVLYPRAGTLGGCTAHNAMIFLYPHNEDWDFIAELTGDRSWSARAMRRYFERVEDCRHRGPWWRLLAKLGINPTRHGWNGWLPAEQAMPLNVMFNETLAATMLDAVREEFESGTGQLDRLRWFIEGQMDPNDWRLVQQNATGLRYAPLTTNGHARTGTRERVRDVARRHPERLRIVTNALATRVLFDEHGRANGVEYLAGERLYRAHAKPNPDPGELRTAGATREVILAGGAFNTPQLLMLSGIGPRAALEQWKIPVRVPLEGVGKNLQDRYELGVVTQMPQRWAAYTGATFGPGDPQYAQWEATPRDGMYTSNGAALTVHRRSPVAGGVPDLFCMALLADFRGYCPGYSERFVKELDCLTWVVLKGHTRNRTGTVTLRSADPREMPDVDFNSFGEGGEEDLRAMADGIEFVRKLTAPLKAGGAKEIWPGEDVQGDRLAAFIRANAWGHHAACSAPIGDPEHGGVLDGDFRVHGAGGLRVVDASVFPRIPGFFIAAPIYMIAEKAADVILADAKRRR
jgi:choline dehydrogenase